MYIHIYIYIERERYIYIEREREIMFYRCSVVILWSLKLGPRPPVTWGWMRGR